MSDDSKIIGSCQWKLVELPPIGEEHMDELKKMMKAQDNFWMNQPNV